MPTLNQTPQRCQLVWQWITETRAQELEELRQEHERLKCCERAQLAIVAFYEWQKVLALPRLPEGIAATMDGKPPTLEQVKMNYVSRVISTSRTLQDAADTLGVSRITIYRLQRELAGSGNVRG